MAEQTEVANRLRALRKRAGLTQEALARTVGCTVTAIVRLEAGRTDPDNARTRMMLDIAQALGVSIYELYGMDRNA